MAVTETASSGRTQERGLPVRGWPAWHSALLDYRAPSVGRSAWQLTSTLLPYAGLWWLMVRSIRDGQPYAVTLALAAITALFLVRAFVLFHDCVHGSLFRILELNTFFGYVLGALAFTPLDDWRFSHLRHHASYANLDARGFGDIWTMTLAEYRAAPAAKRLYYRFFRHPLVLLGMGALISFVLRFRLPIRKSKRKERVSVLFTNVLLAGVILTAARTIGLRTYVLIQLPVIWMAGAMGIWLFYVQHQFPGVYWARKGDWDPMRAAMEGSSFYALPAVLRWFSGSIGYHHVHHLCPRIPNYRLKPCHDSIPELRAKTPLGIRQSLAGASLRLWDEDRRALVGFPSRG